MQDLSQMRQNKYRGEAIKAGCVLFRVLIRVEKVLPDDAQKIAQGLVKYWNETDLTWEFFQSGDGEGVAIYDLTPAFPWSKETDVVQRENCARLNASIVWHVLGDFGKEPLQIKASPFALFNGSSPVYVLDDNIYWSDHYPYSEEMGLILDGEKEEENAMV